MRIEASALPSLEDFLEAAPDAARQAAALAMNDGTKSGLVRYKKAIRGQIQFPSGYLEDEEKFGVTGYATPSRLETKISARQRPTSLARFMTSGSIGKAGVTVRVKGSRTLAKAWPVRLKAGAALTNDNFNLGLAVRIKPGDVIRNKRITANMVHLAPNVFLLYAPSVDQVFRGVAETETPHVLNDMALEFIRQFSRLTKLNG